MYTVSHKFISKLSRLIELIVGVYADLHVGHV